MQADGREIVFYLVLCAYWVDSFHESREDECGCEYESADVHSHAQQYAPLLRAIAAVLGRCGFFFFHRVVVALSAVALVFLQFYCSEHGIVDDVHVVGVDTFRYDCLSAEVFYFLYAVEFCEDEVGV